MTMESMVNYLQARGFKASKRYDPSTKAYVFDVERDNQMTRQFFKYPVDVQPVVRDRIQREFLDSIIKQFDGVRISTYGIEDLYPSTMFAKECKDWRDYLKNEKERKMSTRNIKWKVYNIETESSTDGRFIHATLIGTPDPIFCGTFRDVENDLQKHLDTYMAQDDRTMYVTNDIANARYLWAKQNPYIRQSIPSIKNVVFNDPATIVMWADGTKTVVKCQEGDTFDPEKGLAMAIVKKAYGNKGNYCNQIKKWTKPYEEEQDEAAKLAAMAQFNNPFEEAIKKLKELSKVLKVNQKECKLQAAYHVLYPVLHDSKTTKKEMAEAMEEALGYIGEALDK